MECFTSHSLSYPFHTNQETEAQKSVLPEVNGRVRIQSQAVCSRACILEHSTTLPPQTTMYAILREGLLHSGNGSKHFAFCALNDLLLMTAD